jgi:hypothetical protein
MRVVRLSSQKRALQSLHRYGDWSAWVSFSSEQQPDRRTFVLWQAGHRFIASA